MVVAVVVLLAVVTASLLFFPPLSWLRITARRLALVQDEI